MKDFIIWALSAAVVFSGLAAMKWKIAAIAFSHLMAERDFTFSENELRKSTEYATAHLFKSIRKD
ncbi:MAG: hypothetical protein IJ666_05850 [Ruminococcus sp.]|nr:hypothetical protein [Ruminococcus sp.]